MNIIGQAIDIIFEKLPHADWILHECCNSINWILTQKSSFLTGNGSNKSLTNCVNKL